MRKRLAAICGLISLLALGYTASLPTSRAASCHANHTCRTTTSTTAPTITTTASTTPVPVGTLLFADEFNGTAVDTTKWAAKSYTDNTSGTVWAGFNQISETGGNLVITAQQSGGVWTSGFIAGRVGYTGARYVETRAEVPCGYGTWAAPVWETGHGAPQLEVDEIEQLGREPQTYHTTLHYWYAPGQNNSSGGSVPTGQTLCGGFHTYGAAIYPDHADFYFDGTLVKTVLASAIGLTDLTAWTDYAQVFLNMGGSWAGTPTIGGPVSMLVDYVHVYRIVP